MLQLVVLNDAELLHAHGVFHQPPIRHPEDQKGIYWGWLIVETWKTSGIALNMSQIMTCGAPTCNSWAEQVVGHFNFTQFQCKWWTIRSGNTVKGIQAQQGWFYLFSVIIDLNVVARFISFLSAPHGTAFCFPLVQEAVHPSRRSILVGEKVPKNCQVLDGWLKLWE